LVAGLGQRGASLWECTVHPSRQAESTQQACQRAWELLDRFELRALQDTYSRELSGGQRRLVEVMRCLMRDPRLMLLDEPTVGVAPALSEQLMREYKRIRAEGVCIVIVEHILDVVKEICDRVIVMDIGQVIAEGSYDEVMALPEVREAYFG